MYSNYNYSFKYLMVTFALLLDIIKQLKLKIGETDLSYIFY